LQVDFSRGADDTRKGAFSAGVAGGKKRERAARGVHERREDKGGCKKSMEFIDKREATGSEGGKARICRYLCGFGRGS
jgi:hypothetical protein